MTLIQRVDDVRREAKPLEVRRALLTAWVWPFYAAGLVARKGMTLLSLAAGAFRTGWREGAPK